MKEINLVKSKNNNKEKQVQKNNIVEIANNVCLNTLRNLIPYNKIYNFKK